MADDFYSGKVRTREAGGFRVMQTTYPVQLVMPRHHHIDCYFSFVLSGGFDERIGRTERQVGPSTLIFHPQGEEHEVRFAPVRTKILRIEVPRLLTSRFMSRGIEFQEMAGELKGPAMAAIRRIAGEFENRDTASSLVLEGLCLEFIGTVARSKPANGALADKAEDYLRSHLFDSIRVSQLAAVLGVKSATLARTFRRERGVSVGEFLRTLRLEWAARRLAEPGYSLGEIGAEAGFWDQAHFSRAFREVWGVTPGAYRRSLTYH